jgi:hypothetical protein
VPGTNAYENANQLVDDCESKLTVRSMWCMGYMSGVVDFWFSLSSDGTLKSANRPICMGRSVTIGQLKEIVIKYANGRPDLSAYSAQSIVRAALTAAFPCGQ